MFKFTGLQWGFLAVNLLLKFKLIYAVTVNVETSGGYNNSTCCVHKHKESYKHKETYSESKLRELPKVQIDKGTPITENLARETALENYVNSKTNYDSSNMISQENILRNNTNSSTISFVRKRNLNSVKLSREDILETTEAKDNPYSVLLFTFNVNGERFGPPCTGSLIAPQWILTAAYCLKTVPEVHKVVVYAGGNSQREFVEKQLAIGSQVINSSEHHIHPNYTRDSYKVSFNDVAIVKTKTLFRLTDTVNIVRLPSQPWSRRTFTECKVTGFGEVYKYSHSWKDFVRKTYYLQVKNACHCLEKDTNKGLGYDKYKNKWICTWPIRNVPYGVCVGDYGAGLICDGELKAVTSPLVFVNSPKKCKLTSPDFWECGEKNSLTLFQNICPYGKWINSVTKNETVTGQCRSSSETLAFTRVTIFMWQLLLIICFNSYYL